jgi:two-component system invasion response regulator UvrY
MIRVVLCDDHAMVRRGIKDTLADANDIEVVGEAGSYSEVRDVIRTTPFEVLILDLNLPGRSGMEVLASIRESQTNIRVLIVSMFAEDQYALRCLRAGADGYLNKAGDPSELILAVRSLAKGKKYVTPEISEMLVANLSSQNTGSLHASLSERELQTLLKIASGKRLSEIAEELMLSPKTVSVYRARLLEKLNLASNAELAVYAIRNNLI